MEGRTENWKGHCALSPDQEQGQPLERERESIWMTIHLICTWTVNFFSSAFSAIFWMSSSARPDQIHEDDGHGKDENDKEKGDICLRDPRLRSVKDI